MEDYILKNNLFDKSNNVFVRIRYGSYLHVDLDKKNKYVGIVIVIWRLLKENSC
jgi:hypothetical protein